MKLNLKKEKIEDKKIRGKFLFPRYIFILIGSLILGVNFYLWNGQNLAGNTLPMPFGYGIAVILSGSMEPTLSTNDLAVIHRQKDYEVGDIIVYQSGGELIIHRIIEIEGSKVTTQGDANNTPDVSITLSNVRGKMIAHIPGIGGFVRRLKTPVGMLLILAVAFALLELSYRREWSQEEEEQEKLREEISFLRRELDKKEEEEETEEK